MGLRFCISSNLPGGADARFHRPHFKKQGSTVDLRFAHASYSPGRPCESVLPGPTFGVSESVGLVWGLINCIANTFPDIADAGGLETTAFKPLTKVLERKIVAFGKKWALLTD